METPSGQPTPWWKSWWKRAPALTVALASVLVIALAIGAYVLTRPRTDEAQRPQIPPTHSAEPAAEPDALPHP